jgi:hypothetical protein
VGSRYAVLRSQLLPMIFMGRWDGPP